MKSYPYILIIGSVIGLVASFVLTIETLNLAKNPQAELTCDINVFLSCGSVIETWQGYVFGFPNPILGLISFSMLIAVGVMHLFGGRANKIFWLLVNFGIFLSLVFVIWFIYQSFLVIGALCIYCLVTWIVTWPLFLYTTVWNYRENHFKFEKIKVRWQNKIDAILKNISSNHIHYFIGWYFVLAFLIGLKLREYLSF